MRIIQIATNLVPGDAISNHVFELDKILKKAGNDSWICGVDIDERLLGKYSITKFEELPEINPQDIIMYHLCQRHYINELIDDFTCKKILVYHNISPGHYFRKYLPVFSKHLDDSVDAIKSMNSGFDWCIADSEFNKQQLIEFGYNEEIINVIPIPLDFSDFSQPPDEETVNKYSDGYTNILFVGRIAPNKKFE
jgi:glycosyltransferase involved in cell wall biosynthesis